MGRFIKTLQVSGVTLLLLCGVALLVFAWPASGRKALSVQSDSMVPHLHKGDLVIVKRVPTSKLRVGDVITFMNPHNQKQTITHRIVELPSQKNSKFVTKGDANKANDTAISAHAVIGRVTGSIPFAGFVMDFARHPMGLLFVVYLPALMIVSDEWRRLMQYYKKRQQVYRLYRGRLKRHATNIPKGVLSGVKVIAPCLIIACLLTLPARAALGTTATLTGNSITSISMADHLLISRVEFECWPHNTNEFNTKIKIWIYNPTNTDIQIEDWYVESSEERLLTFHHHTIRAHHSFQQTVHLDVGLHFAGDFLLLFNTKDEPVDAISWGSNTVYLNPSLPPLAPDTTTIFSRSSLITDTNTAADWTMSTSPH